MENNFLEKYNNALKIINNALEKNISINKSEKDLGFYDKYFKRVLDSDNLKHIDENDLLTKTYNKYLENKKLDIKVNESITEKYDNRTKWWVERDLNNKIITYKYIIYVNNDNPLTGELTRQQMETIYQYYPYVTANNVSSYFPYLTFDKFKKILRCFNITKDKLFPQHILEESNEDDIAEYALKNKESASLKKIVEQRSNFIEKQYFDSQKTILELQDIQKYIDETIDKYYTSDMKNINFNISNNTKSNNIGCLFYSDIHYGKSYSSPTIGRGFNKDIANERMSQILESTIKYIKENNIQSLYVLFGGDLLESILHNGMHSEHLKKMDLFGVDQLFFAIDSQVEFFRNLQANLPDDFKIYVTLLGGNHDRIGINRDDDKERTGGLIAYNVIMRHFNNENIQFHIPKKNLSIMKFYDDNMKTCIISHHGDSKLMQLPASELVNLHGIGNEGYHLVINGHWHSANTKTKSGTNFMEISLPSVCSVDDFIHDELGKNLLPGFILGHFENNGFSYTQKVLY
jgi:hypothetical protein